MADAMLASNTAWGRTSLLARAQNPRTAYMGCLLLAAAVLHRSWCPLGPQTLKALSACKGSPLPLRWMTLALALCAVAVRR
jgi:hypothetical protein